MSSQRACDLCGFYRQDHVHRYGLSRQINQGNGFKTVRGFGGLDICDECWAKKAAPKQRPELVGKTGRKRENHVEAVR